MKTIIKLILNFIIDIATPAFGFILMIGAINIGTFLAGLILFLTSFGFYIKDNFERVNKHE